MKKLLLLALLPTACSAANAPSTTSIRQMIGREKVATFSKDYLIKGGLAAKDLANFEAAIKTAMVYINPQEEALLPGIYRNFNTLDRAYDFAKKSISTLNKRYAQNYVKDETGKLIPDFSKAPLSGEDLKELTTINTQAKDFQKDILAVSDKAFPRAYIESQPAPILWATAIEDQTKDLIFPDHKKFITDYTKSKSFENFKKNFGAKYNLTDEKGIATLLDKIERYTYKLEQETFSLLNQDIKTLKKCAAEIRKEFPAILSTLDFNKIALSTSFQRTVLSAYAEAIEGVINQIVRETNTLLAAAKK